MMKEEELNDLKYRDLQKVAKDNGIKANMPKAALITALLEVFQKDEKAEIPSNPNPIHEIPQEEQNPIVESIKSIVTPSKPIEIAIANLTRGMTIGVVIAQKFLLLLMTDQK